MRGITAMAELPKSPETISKEELILLIKQNGLVPNVQQVYEKWVEQERIKTDELGPQATERIFFEMRKGIVLFEGGIYVEALKEFESAGFMASQNVSGISPDEKDELQADINRWIWATRDRLEK